MMLIVISAPKHLIWLGLACQVTPISTFIFMLFHGLSATEDKMMCVSKRASSPGAYSDLQNAGSPWE